MKRLINVALAVVLLVGLYGYYNPGFAQDESSGNQEQSENSVSSTENEGSTTENSETPSGEQPPEENKVYSCPKCGFTSDGPGDCPACNVSLTEGSSETPSEGGDSGSDSGSDEASETGGDSTAPTGDESGSSDSEGSAPPAESQE